MAKKFFNRAKEQKKIARERINELFKQAESSFKEDSSYSDRYVELARKIAMKSRMRIPSELKKRFCKHCYSFLVPGANCRVRIQDNKKIVYHCLKCGKYMRFPYVRDKK